jgi:hypothetical protein
MANDNVVKFPKSPSIEQRIEMKQHRLRELETENGYINADIEHLTKAHASNLKEYGELVKELAALWKLVAPEVEGIEFEADFDSDFDFDFDFDFNPEEDK